MPRTRQKLIKRRKVVFAAASEVVANVENLDLFGGAHLAVALQTSLQAEEKLLEPPKLKGLQAKPGTPLLTHVV